MENSNTTTNIPLSQFGSLPNFSNRLNSILPYSEESRSLPQSAPNAHASSTETVLTEIYVVDRNNTETSETNPTEALGTLRMHHHDVTSWEPSCLQTFLKISNYTGFAPYRFTMHNQKEKFGKMGPYIIVSLLSILQSSRMIKILILEAITKADDPDVRFYILLWRAFVQALMRVAAIRTFMNGEKFSSLLNRMDETWFGKRIHTRKKFWIATLLVLTSYVLAFAGSFFGFPYIHEQEWSFSSLLQYRATEVKQFFVSSNYNQTIELFFVPPNNIDVGTALLGSLGCFMKFIGIAADQLDRLIILFSILILKQGIDDFNFDNMPMGVPASMITLPSLIGEQIKMRYNDLKMLSKSINDVFEQMIEVFLLHSLLTLADFFSVIFSANNGLLPKVFHSAHIITILSILYTAICVSKKVRIFRDWLTSEPGPEKIGMTRDDIQSILNELATNPIGVGRDSLYANKGFLIGFFGIATGYFFSTVETRAPGCDCS